MFVLAKPLVSLASPTNMAEWVEFENQGLVRVDQQTLVITDQGRLVSRALVQPFDQYMTEKPTVKYSRIL